MNFRISYIFIISALIVSIIIGMLTYFFTSFYNFKGFEKALEGVLLFSSISLGFYGACLSVIASIFNSKVVKEIMGEKEDKIEFVVLVVTTLITGFLTVVLTIIYQVLIENGSVKVEVLGVINGFWAGLGIMFVAMNIIFVLVSFMIFFNNDKESGSNKVYNPKMKNRAK
ncbi:hypothetical protein ACTNEO_05095 [Gracilibacillus sp. HCP3S3_G5_1]|uniref:hypothetical protein n=1 Tax=unclassified Gracilibacillus TaxID=2625209 RepID=UPI003F8CB692